ncbi:MAG UNVERIFIED_CONTAM: LacI family transcriptional regulator [Anaerolineae bacterium]|jgi:DNA-binding LacI/PurR family transcriptional regulator
MKVIAAIDALGYRPNMHARSLRTQQTQLIAVLVADITNSFYPQIARSIQQIARHHGYDAMISNSDHVHEYEQHFCETMIRRTVDGIILVPFHLTEFDLHELYRETKTPIAVLGNK